MTLRASPLHLLHRASQAADEIFYRDVPHDITPRQFVLLVAIAANEGASQTALTCRTGIDRSTLASMVARLQRKGLLRRARRRDDARAYRVQLTQEGHRLVRSAEPKVRVTEARLLEALSQSRRQRFLDALTAVVRIGTASAPKY